MVDVETLDALLIYDNFDCRLEILKEIDKSELDTRAYVFPFFRCNCCISENVISIQDDKRYKAKELRNILYSTIGMVQISSEIAALGFNTDCDVRFTFEDISYSEKEIIIGIEITNK